MFSLSESEGNNAASLLHGAWAVAKPTRHDFAAVVTKLNAACLVGEGSVFSRGTHSPVIRMAYFKPPADALLNDLSSKDRRSAKEWEYINGTGFWVETGPAALELTKEGEGRIGDLARRHSLAKSSFKAAPEALSMRTKFFS